MSSVSAHTCITCRVLFSNAEVQREHYKTDWHRYNLKRKVAELPPVTAEVFRSKVLSHQENIASSQKEEERVSCELCNKWFKTNNAYINHINSKRHKEIESQIARPAGNSATGPASEKIILPDSEQNPVGQDVETDSDDEHWDEESGLGLEECLFCSTSSESLESNLQHMSEIHGFFVVDLHYCVDVEGLVLYLGKKVGAGFMCLWCENKAFHSLDGVQKHMRDKGHCKMRHEEETMIEYEPFYDFSTSFPDATVAQNPDDEVELPVIPERDWSLVLPSGCTIGHRSLRRYYQQNLKPETRVAVLEKCKRATQGILVQYKALGWTGETDRVKAQQRARDIQFLKRLQSKQSLKLGVGGNKLQRYLRRVDL